MATETTPENNKSKGTQIFHMRYVLLSNNSFAFNIPGANPLFCRSQ
jgi:hypothetical protein